MNPLPLLRVIKVPPGSPAGLDDAARMKIYREWMRITEELIPYLPDGSDGPYFVFIGEVNAASGPFGKPSTLDRLQGALKFFSIASAHAVKSEAGDSAIKEKTNPTEKQELYREWVRVTEELSRFFPKAAAEYIPAFLAQINEKIERPKQPGNDGPTPTTRVGIGATADFAATDAVTFVSSSDLAVASAPARTVAVQSGQRSVTPFDAERQRVEYWLTFMAAAGFTMPSQVQISRLQAALRRGTVGEADPETIRQYVEVYANLIGAKNAGRGPLEYQGKGMGPTDAEMLRVVEGMARTHPALTNSGAAVEIAASVAGTMAAKIDLLRMMKGVRVEPAMVLLLLAARFQQG